MSHEGSAVTPPSDTELLAVLHDRDGQRTLVTLADGRELTVMNIAWGYDDQDPWADVTTNISPDVEGQGIDLFFTHEVTAVYDESRCPLFVAPE